MRFQNSNRARLLSLLGALETCGFSLLICICAHRTQSLGDLQREVRPRLRWLASRSGVARLVALHDRRAAYGEEAHHLQMGRPQAGGEQDRLAATIYTVLDCRSQNRALGAAQIRREEIDDFLFFLFLFFDYTIFQK